jgi:small GTP-binding protein
MREPVVRKVLMLGEIGVGKTSISRRLVFNSFGDNYKATIGVDVYSYDVKPDPSGMPFKFLIWDTDGSHGESIFRQYFARQAQAAMIVADVTRPSTVETMMRLGRLFEDVLPGRYCGYVLNKTDLEMDTAVADMLGRLESTHLPLFKTSALTGDNVAQAFHDAATSIIALES